MVKKEAKKETKEDLNREITAWSQSRSRWSFRQSVLEVEPGCEEAEDEDINVIAENEEAEADKTAIGLPDVYYDSAFESDSDTDMEF